VVVELPEQESITLEHPPVIGPAVVSEDAIALEHPPVIGPAVVGGDAELAARRSLRSQIVRLEKQLAEAFVTAAPMGAVEPGFATSSSWCATS
jgi:hypothetical protein